MWNLFIYLFDISHIWAADIKQYIKSVFSNQVYDEKAKQLRVKTWKLINEK